MDLLAEELALVDEGRFARLGGIFSWMRVFGGQRRQSVL